MPPSNALRLLLAFALVFPARPSSAAAQPSDARGAFDQRVQQQFLAAIASYEAHDYEYAELLFRRILDRDPQLLRVRLELARTLFMERKDEQADYHFRLAAGERPPQQVIRNIVRFREAIRARRAWRFNFEIGFAPDSNINSATEKQTVDIYGLPFQLDAGGRAHSGTGHFFGGDASIRLNRDGKMPIYVGAYGRSVHYRDHQFDDTYAGVEAGPEFKIGGGRLRTTASALKRWYSEEPLLTTLGGGLEYERLIGSRWTVDSSLLFRNVNYARRRDVDGWEAAGRISAERAMGPSTLGSAWVGMERNWANDPGQAYWREQLGAGILKEIDWGLRPQLRVEVAHQLNDSPLAPFGTKRRDWLLEGTFSVYKRDWSLQGFAPSFSLSFTRDFSTLALYDEKRLRAEFALIKAF